MSHAILLTGASGFIGSALFDVLSLLARHSVVVVPRDVWMVGG
jgi:nucleoside-diphosphate-sugar epimerase